MKYEILYTNEVSNFRVSKGKDGIYFIELNHNLSYDYKKRAVERCINDVIRSKAFPKKTLKNLIGQVGWGKIHKVIIIDDNMLLLRARNEYGKRIERID